MKLGTRWRSSRSCCWRSGRSRDEQEPGAEEACGGLLAGTNRFATISITSRTSGNAPSGNVAVDSPVMTSSRSSGAILDVGGEAFVEELQRLVRHLGLIAPLHRPTVTLQLVQERGVVGLGNTEEIGDHQQREGARVLVDELALPSVEELVDLTIGESPHEFLVLLEALRSDEPHQQRTMLVVLGRMERGHLIAERRLVRGARRSARSHRPRGGRGRPPAARPRRCTTRTFAASL